MKLIKTSELEGFTRLFEENTCNTAFFDCTELRRLASRRHIPFLVVLLHAILRGVNRLEAFRNRIVDEEYLVCYDRIDLITTEKSGTEGCRFYQMFTPYSSSLDEFHACYLERRRQTKEYWGVTDARLVHLNTIRINVLSNLRFTQVTPCNDRMAKRGSLYILIGKYEEDAQGRVTIPIGVSFPHALLDGADFNEIAGYTCNDYAHEE